MGALDSLFIAVHVPKCAGRTLERHVLRHLPGNECWVTTKRFVRTPHIVGRHYQLRDPRQLQATRVISGHHAAQSMERLFPDRDIMHSVLIREPVSFHLSYYNFRMMRYIERGWRPHSFELHLKSQPHDPITHFLSPQKKYNLVNRALSKFWFVADLSKCDELIALMSRDLAIPETAERCNTSELWTARTHWQPLTRDDIAPKTLEALTKRTRIDKAVWHSWRNAGVRTAAVRPIPLEGMTGLRFPVDEAARPAFSAVRRYQRGWN
jgi:hypothetical protein